MGPGLQDLVDQHLREAHEVPAMQAVMGGKFAQQIICRSVSYRSEKEEDFFQVPSTWAVSHFAHKDFHLLLSLSYH